ncbi:MAG: ABC transporter ATP-binding protein [Clostridiales bacterium]|nr:ABC transporter ATP-binding protein [Clostridiales bacterium]
MIQVENLVKKYGNHTAVDQLSFTVEKGQIYGFLGPNGAGKSTTMNIITGYIAASSGTVSINGYDILKEPVKAKKCIGYLPEVPPLYSDMTVREYLAFVAELKKIPRKERKEHLEEIIDRIQLGDVADRLIRNLSKGYKQRVGLAQALIGYPEIIILDEPMVGLDPKQIIEMRDLIKGLAKEHTVILSSHILSEVSAVCDHIMIISKGKLVASGSPEQLQEMMQGGSELEVTVMGDEAQAEAVLKEMELIESYTFEQAEESNCVRIRIVSKENLDIRRELSVALSGAQLPILSMNRREKTLEDIFLELTDTQEEEIQEEAAKADDDSDAVDSDAQAGQEAGQSEEDAHDTVDAEKEETDNDSDL